MIRLSSLGEEIDPLEMNELLSFAFERHIARERLNRDRTVREGIWLLMQNMDPFEIAFDPLERARILGGATAQGGACARSVERIVESWNRAFPHQPITFSIAAERALDCVYRRCDPHSSFFARAEWENLSRSISGEYSGIGILVTHSEEPVVSEVFEGGPSDGQLRRFDRIVAVNGHEVRGLTSDEYLGLIRGDAGTTVQLRVRRDRALLDVNLTRQKLKARAVRRTEAGKNGDILVLRLWSFIDGSGAQISEALEKARKPLRGVILDLRNNGGGTVDDAVEIVDQFIDRGLVITERNTTSRELLAEDRGTAISDGVPVIILVNRFSASASELTAGALRDHGRAVIMGETTYGKGTVQEIYRFGQRGAKVTVARFYLPLGRSTQLVGVAPDLEFPDAQAAEVAAEAEKGGVRLFEREYDNAVSADVIFGGFKPGQDLEPVIERLEQRMAAPAGPPDEAVELDDAMLQRAIQLLEDEAPVPVRE